MEPIAEILRDLRLEHANYARSELSAPWGIGFTRQEGSCLHFIVSGHCWLRVENDCTELRAGDLVLLPHGDEHLLCDSLTSPVTPLADIPRMAIGEHTSFLQFGGRGAPSLLVCGCVRFTGPVSHPLLALLPRMLLLRFPDREPTATSLSSTLSLLSVEASSDRAGSALIMTRLADLLVLQAIRAWLEQNPAHEGGWLAALRDPQIGQALALIHSRGDDPWSVESLAREVNLSRSAFSERFTRLVGVSPMRYLTRWRMQLATTWMREKCLSSSEAAYRLGYSSEAAFSRAFKRHLNVPPGAVRRSA
jgi:AraC-like DNA-binding protein